MEFTIKDLAAFVENMDHYSQQDRELIETEIELSTSKYPVQEFSKILL